jgi:hypothetical protein
MALFIYLISWLQQEDYSPYVLLLLVDKYFFFAPATKVEEQTCLELFQQ